MANHQLHHGVQGGDAAIMQIRAGHGDIAQTRHLEDMHVCFVTGDHITSQVVGRVRLLRPQGGVAVAAQRRAVVAGSATGLHEQRQAFLLLFR